MAADYTPTESDQALFASWEDTLLRVRAGVSIAQGKIDLALMNWYLAKEKFPGGSLEGHE